MHRRGGRLRGGFQGCASGSCHRRRRLPRAGAGCEQVDATVRCRAFWCQRSRSEHASSSASNSTAEPGTTRSPGARSHARTVGAAEGATMLDAAGARQSPGSAPGRVRGRGPGSIGSRPAMRKPRERSFTFDGGNREEGTYSSATSGVSYAGRPEGGPVHVESSGRHGAVQAAGGRRMSTTPIERRGIRVRCPPARTTLIAPEHGANVLRRRERAAGTVRQHSGERTSWGRAGRATDGRRFVPLQPAPQSPDGDPDRTACSAVAG